ncbi:MAG: DNA cytosine methyltransferase [Parvimonas sp.]|uniref:DNA cytosine methyltransferase n=1 Tax=Parvimonas sp. TaxID=1944660 RepID=UPI002A75E813|nr:DNA cytosine methyltransferase [Parvimonas sp.]MDY3050687.1 DNA cytosine methyltransferase [Parvimonas sp.]
MKIKTLSLFSGLGAFEEALKNLNIENEIVGYSEIENFISKSYSIIHKVDENKNLGDISKIDIEKIPKFDLVTYGFPCQDISVIGKQKGLDKDSNTRSSLVWNIFKIIEYHKPKYLVGENVKNLIGKFKDDFNLILENFETLGYRTYYKVLNSKNFGVPQNRERVYIVSIRNDLDVDFYFDECIDDSKRLIDILEMGQNFTKDYYFTDLKGIINKTSIFRERFEVLNPYKNVSRCLLTKSCKATITNTYIVDFYGIRGLTERECFKLQGFDVDYVELLKRNGVSKNQLYYMIGNSITVNVLEMIFKKLFKNEEERMKC